MSAPAVSSAARSSTTFNFLAAFVASASSRRRTPPARHPSRRAPGRGRRGRSAPVPVSAASSRASVSMTVSPGSTPTAAAGREIPHQGARALELEVRQYRCGAVPKARHC